AGFCIFTKHSNGRFKIQLYFDHQLRVMRQDTIRWGRSLTVTCWGAYYLVFLFLLADAEGRIVFLLALEAIVLAVALSFMCSGIIDIFNTYAAKYSRDRRKTLTACCLSLAIILTSVIGLTLAFMYEKKAIQFDGLKPDNWFVYFVGTGAAIFWATSTRALATFDQKVSRIRSLKDQIGENPENLGLMALFLDEVLIHKLEREQEFEGFFKAVRKRLTDLTTSAKMPSLEIFSKFVEHRLTPK
ncbi:MAG TPA: hypothetical protein VE954_28820, partial [Oligoflexus sp.]|uniref:hypothetical protein n=1 Tax=Oligoflexus sp. TaxID=1971216 RepID=UPI002D6B185C